MSERNQFEAWANDYGLRSEPNYSKHTEADCWAAWQAARAQPAQAVPLHQILTDPENRPNQYGVEFLMRGPKFAFKVGTQQFTLDYEPTEPGEFEFMRDALIHAFSVFTPDVKPAQAGQVLSDDAIKAAALEAFDCTWDADDETLVNKYGHGVYLSRFIDFARAIEAAVLAKRVPMTESAWQNPLHPDQISDKPIPNWTPLYRLMSKISDPSNAQHFSAEAAAKAFGIVGKEGA